MKNHLLGAIASAKQITEGSWLTQDLVYSSGGDTNGLFYWLGSHDLNGDAYSWAQPWRKVLVSSTAYWDGGYGPPLATISRGADTYNSWVATSALPNDIVFNLSPLRKFKPNKLTIQSEGNGGCHPKDWIFYGSNDGATWVPLQTVTDSGINATYTWFSFDVTPPSVGYSYFKIDVTATSGGGSVRVNEIELYGELSQVSGLTFYEEGPPDNSGTKGYFYYRGTHDSNGDPRAWVNPVGNGITQTVNVEPWGNLGIHLSDRNPATKWHTDGVQNSWSKWDLGVGRSLVLSGFYMYTEQQYTGSANFKFQGSNDDTNWTDLHILNSPFYWDTYTLRSTGCTEGVTDAFRYIRLLTGSVQASIYDVELYGYEPA